MSIIARMWAGNGYTVVIQGVRGYFGSGGIYEPFIHERQDGINTLEWLKRQSWYDGHVGMWGGSYFGYTQYAIADQLNPETSALMVQISTPDMFKFFYPGHAYSYEGSMYWALRSHTGEDLIPSSEKLHNAYAGFPTIESDERSGQSIPFYDVWTQNINHLDAYWQNVNTEQYVSGNAIPILFMAGWSDPFLPFQIQDFIKAQKNNPVSRIIIGPWKHASTITLPGDIVPNNYRMESLRYAIPWFDKILKNKADCFELPPVKLFVMGENIWRDEAEWPLARTQFQNFYLNFVDGNGSLVPSAGLTSHITFVYDPLNPVPSNGGASLGPTAGINLQNESQRSDVVSYRTPVLESDMEITGPLKLILYVATDVLSTDFTAKLVDVFPDGRSYNISDGITRESFTPDTPEKIEIELWPTSILIPKGHQLRLEISSSNYPRFDRNPNTSEFIPTATSSKSANQTIYHGKSYPSYLILPVIPR